MIQCPETHLFCGNCLRAYASSLLGTQNPDIKCMDLSGCNALIPESELKRFLSKKVMKLWERSQQRKEIQAAGLKGLAECPFCDYSVIIESSEEKLLQCGNEEECGVISCRMCKKPVSSLRFTIVRLPNNMQNHLPKQCDGMFR
jgi:E3 ubiquitin-protein ligase RNF216